MLASQFNYEGSAKVATSYKYSCYANIHVRVEIIAARREHNIVIHIHCVMWNIGIQSNVIDNNKIQRYKLTCNSCNVEKVNSVGEDVARTSSPDTCT